MLYVLTCKFVFLLSVNPEKQTNQTRQAQTTNNERRINSALNYLSNDYTIIPPDGTEKPTTRRKKPNRKVITIAASTRMSSHHFEIVNNNANEKKKIQKFISKALNDEVNKKYQPLIVIQAQKDMPKTPSSSSYTKDTLERLSTPGMLQSLKGIKTEDINKAAKEILLAVQSKRSKLKALDEPNTLVSEHQKEEEKDIYDFFVKLLEKTFDVYNVKTDFQSEPTQSKNLVLEIDEQVAKKLNVKKKPDRDFNKSKTTETYFNMTDDRIYTWQDQQIQVMQREPKYRYLEPPLVKLPERKTTLYSRSFTYASRKGIKSPEPKPQKRRSKNYRNLLLDTLKEELKMDKDDFEEPQNIHEALRIIAKNKRKCRNHIHTDKNVKFMKIGDGTVTDCQFKRKRVISTRGDKKLKKQKKFNKTSTNSLLEPKNFICLKKTKPSQYTKVDDYRIDESIKTSIQSIEVKGYDFDDNTNTRQIPDLRWKESPCSMTNIQCLSQADSSRLQLNPASKHINYMENERNDDENKCRDIQMRLISSAEFNTDSDADESLELDSGSNCSSLLSAYSDSLSKLLTPENQEFLKNMTIKKIKI